jgi:hypothetical protein
MATKAQEPDRRLRARAQLPVRVDDLLSLHDRDTSCVRAIERSGIYTAEGPQQRTAP